MPTARDIVFGAVGGVMVLMAVVLLFVGGERDTGSAVAVEIPALQIVTPDDGAEVWGPLRIEFRSSRVVEHGSGGWGVDDLHIHLDIDGRSFMPASRDIERISDGEYRWSLPALPPGAHTLRLYWSGPDHRALEDGGSEPVRVNAS